MDVNQAGKATTKKKRGRPREITISESKRRRQGEIKRYKRTLVGLTSAYEPWNELRKKGKWTHSELALHLLDVHAKSCGQPNCKVTVPVEQEVVTKACVKGMDELRKIEVR